MEGGMENQQNEPRKENVEQTNALNFYKKASNPVVALIHMLLKICAAASFLILGVFTSNDAIIMLIVISLGAMDFWFTKNISGRILVGLRWWNFLNQKTGEERWIYESKNESKSFHL